MNCCLSCQNKKINKYGNYCNKHKRNHLVKDDLINYNNFTKKSSDYLKGDIYNTLKKMDIPAYNAWKKNYLFELLNEEYIKLDKYDNNIDTVIMIQRKIKNKSNKLDKLRGEGFKDKSVCNNDNDFFTFDSIDEISSKYFFSYKDNSGFIWFFDIRSFNKLIEMKQDNPYTREPISVDVKLRSKELTDKLKLSEDDSLVNMKEIHKTKSQIIKQKTIDLFAEIEQNGYSCLVEWFLDLSISRLKSLYRNLEDIWNYRLQLSNEIKCRISPPGGLVFNIPINDVMSNNNKVALEEIIINEVFKFNNAVSPEDKKLGYMYFIIGLGQVSKRCFQSHQWWLQHTIN